MKTGFIELIEMYLTVGTDVDMLMRVKAIYDKYVVKE